MGKLMSFGKVRLVIQGRDHNPPHFHVKGGDINALVGIAPVVILHDSLPADLWFQVRAWAEANRAVLVAEWNRCNPLFPIA